MAGLPQFLISTQTDPYWEIPFYDAAGHPLSVAGRTFEAWITPATSRTGVGEPVAPLKVLTFADGLSLVPPTDGSGTPAIRNTFVHRVSRAFAQANFPRGELTADILEVVDGARRLLVPVRLRYDDPAAIRDFVADRAGIIFGAGRQPISTPVAVAGQTGKRGAGFLTGAQPPQPSDGEDGDYWVVERAAQASLLYGPKDAGAWPAQPSSTLGVGSVRDVPGLPESLARAPYPSRAAAQSETVPASVNTLRTQGYLTAGDGGGDFYIRTGTGAGDFQTAGGVGWRRVVGPVSPEQFGAKGDGSTNDRAALASASAYALANSVPLELTRPYNVGTAAPAVTFGAITVRPGPNARVIGNYDLHDAVTVTSALRLERQDPFNSYAPLLLQPTYKRPIGQKTLHLSEGDVIYDAVAKIPGSGLLLQRLNWDAGNVDEWVAETAAGYDADTLLYNLTNDGFVHAGFRPAHGGDELSTAWDAGTYTRAAVIRGTFGTILAYAQGDGTLTIATKPIGQAATLRPGIDWTGRGDHPAWLPSNAVWTIRLYSLTQWTLMLNGVEILQPQTVPAGFITQMGFGAMASTTVQAVMRFFTRTRSTRSPGRGYFDILTGGDSTTADIHGAWPPAMLEALQGSLGASVRRVVNIAQDGATSVQQYSTLQATDLGPFSDLVINIGTNDVQNPGAAGTRNASLARIGQMIDHGQARFKRVTILVFPTWYAKELTGAVPGGPVGVFTANSALSSSYRQGIKALAAAKNCKVVDLNEELEPALAYALTNGQPDIVLRDNIHPTEFRYRMIGNLVAAALLGQWPRKTRALSETLLPASSFRNGWIAGTPAPNVTVTRDGWAKLAGVLKGGTMSGSGVLVLQIPPNLYPRSVKIGSLRGATTGSPVTYTLGTGGNLTVFNASEADIGLDMIPAYEIAD